MSDRTNLLRMASLGRVYGAKGKGGSSSASSKEDPNTLRSNVKARIIDLLGEGKIAGFPSDNPLKDVYFDRTPVMNADGSLNFQGVTFDYRLGLPDQEELTGFAMTESPFSVSARVYKNQGPITRTIADRDATAVRVIIQIPNLTRTVSDGKSPGVFKNSVQYAFDVRSNNGSWTEAVSVSIDDKCTSPYQRSHRIELPAGGFPWQVRMRRISEDSTDDKIQNQTIWDSYIEVVEARLTYMHSAVAALQVDAKQFGSNIPARSYRLRGLEFQVPSNYDPVTRAYTGLWDGTFKTAWTNNPAWVFYGLVTNTRFGLGEFVDASKMNVAGLYQIARYCDELVDDGYGKKEPRYTYNGVLNTLREAHKALQAITAVFRGMSFWSLGQIFAVADMPKDPVVLVTRANTVGGFEYSGTAMKARHTVAAVSWNDPEDFYRPAIELVRDNDAIRKFGWRQTDVTAEGCTSQGQAHRNGAWIIDSEQNEIETVVYRASFDHTAMERDDIVTGVLPGDVVAIADPKKMRIRAGGRIIGVAGARRVHLDAPFPMAAGESYVLKITNPDLKIQSVPLVSVDEQGFATLSKDLVQTPLEGAVYIISGTDAAPRQFRVLEVAEEAKNAFKVTALFFDPTKFARVEQGIKLAPIAYRRIKQTLDAPTNLHVSESRYMRDGLPRARLTFSWTAGGDFLTTSFVASALTPDMGVISFGNVATPSVDLEDIVPGEYIFNVYGMSPAGKLSAVSSITHTALGWADAATPYVGNLRVKNGPTGSTFAGTACTVVWNNLFPPDATAFTPENLVSVYDATTDALLRQEVVSQESYTYSLEKNLNDAGPRRRFRIEVAALDVLGRPSAPTGLTCSNPAPARINPIISTGAELIFIRYVKPSDTDYAGTLIWIETNPDFDPLATAPVYDGPGTSFSMKAETDRDYYVVVGAHDVFGRVGINLTTKFKITPKANMRLTFDDLGELLRTKVEADPEIRDLQRITQSVLDRITETDERATATYETLLRLRAEGDQAAVELIEQVRSDLSDEKTARTSSVQQLSQTVVTSNEAFSAYKTTTSASFGSLVAGMLGYEGRLANSEARVTEISNAQADDKAARAIFERDTSARFGRNEATIHTNETAIADVKTAQAGFNQLVESRFKDARDLVNNETTERRAAVDTTIATVASYDKALANYRTSVDSTLGSISSSIGIQASTIARANEAVATLQQDVAAKFGNTSAGGTFRIVARPANSDAVARASIEVRALNHDDPNEGWVESGTYWEVYQDPPGSGNLRGRIANKADQFYVIDTGTNVMSVPLRVENGIVYIDKLVVKETNVNPGTLFSGNSVNSGLSSATSTMTMNVRKGSSLQIFLSYDGLKKIEYTGTEQFHYILRLKDMQTGTTLKDQSIAYGSQRDNSSNNTLTYQPTLMQHFVTFDRDRTITLEGSIRKDNTLNWDGVLVQTTLAVLRLNG